MAKAKAPGGLYYIGETAVDAHGKAVEGAPSKQPNTDPSIQPGALGAPTAEERMAAAIAKGIREGSIAAAPAAASKPKDEDKDEDTKVRGGKLPTIAELPDVLAKITDVASIKTMAASDDRVTAEPLYTARIAKLSGE